MSWGAVGGKIMKLDYFKTRPPFITCRVFKAIQTAAKDKERK